LLLSGWSCSGQNSVLRSSGSDSSSDSSGFQAKPGSRPVDEGEGASGYTDAHIPIPIDGTNLVEVSGLAHCEASCTGVRLDGTIKVDGKSYWRYGGRRPLTHGITLPISGKVSQTKPACIKLP